MCDAEKKMREKKPQKVRRQVLERRRTTRDAPVMPTEPDGKRSRWTKSTNERNDGSERRPRRARCSAANGKGIDNDEKVGPFVPAPSEMVTNCPPITIERFKTLSG